MISALRSAPRLLMTLLVAAGGIVLEYSPLLAQSPPRSAPSPGDSDPSDLLDADPFAEDDFLGLGSEEDVSEFFDLEDFESPRKLTFHGSIDLTFVQFEDSQNIGGFPRRRLTPFEPKLVIRYTPGERHLFLTEIEVDGLDWELELEQFSYRFLPNPSTELGVGIQYIPFGIERFYNSPARNPLVDRPAPFKRIFPGTYADLGLFLRSERTFASEWRVTFEAALTRSLEGPTRDDRPDPFDEIDQVQPSGRIGISSPYGLSAGVSALHSRYEDGVGGHEELTLTGLDLSYRYGETIVRAEAILGEVGRPDAEGGDYDRYGWYAEIYHRFPGLIPWGEAIEAVVRYDELEVNDTVRDFRDIRRFAFGLNWVIDESWRLKTEVSISKEDGDSVANDGRFIQLEYHF